jgi:putative SOS response-associated peptidase YedK
VADSRWSKTDELITEFVAEGVDFRDWRPSHNIAPTDTIPILIQFAEGDGDAVRRLEPARWSLVAGTKLVQDDQIEVSDLQRTI